MAETQLPNFPLTADLCTEVFQPLPVVAELPADVHEDGGASICAQVLSTLSNSLASNNGDLENIFLADGAYWRDTLAFTYHLRTFHSRKAIAKALHYLNQQRESNNFKVTENTTAVITGGPSLVSTRIDAFCFSNQRFHV